MSTTRLPARDDVQRRAAGAAGRRDGSGCRQGRFRLVAFLNRFSGL